MTCYFPLIAYKSYSKDPQKMKLVFKRSLSQRDVEVALPCGQCIGCKLERSRQWAVRCMHEASLYEENCFLTLTYSNDFLPKNGSLVLSDFQNFMKRLRKSIAPKRVRFFHCGEYGEQFERPHYHALLFNYNFSDRKFFKRGGNESTLWTSSTLSKLWPMGHALIGDVTFDSASYVARYILKKVTGERSEEHYKGRIPEYTTMSRRPGIGKGWYEKFKGDVYPLDRVVVRGNDTRPPRFYDSLFAREDPSAFALIKIKREKNGNHFVDDVLSDGTCIRVSDSSMRRLIVKEHVKQAQISTLKRSLEKQ